MSVICKNEMGWVVCHFKAVQDVYRRCQSADQIPSPPPPPSFQWKKELFDIRSPFLMDSQFLKLQSDPEQQSQTRARKKKRKLSDLNVGEIQAMEYHEKVSSIISRAHHSLVELAQKQGHFVDSNPGPVDNNMSAREAAKLEGPSDMLIQCCDDKDIRCQLQLDHFYKIHHTQDLNVDHEDPSYLKVQYDGHDPRIVSVAGHEYLLPPHSTFILSDLATFKDIYPVAGGPYHAIVIDPPWQNKSVKRLKSYWCETDWNLESLAIPELVAPNCLVAVWVTNRRKHQEFVRETLFKKWNVSETVTWFWLKVTTCGETVSSMESRHKKPYEVLMLGRHKKTDPAAAKDEELSPNSTETIPGSPNSTKTIPGSPTRTKTIPGSPTRAKTIPGSPTRTKTIPGSPTRTKTIPGSPTSAKTIPGSPNCTKTIPDSQLLISVPCSLHSKKPPLADVLSEYLPDNPRCLELFARNLWPQWTSWGNEVFKHQHLDYFEPVADGPPAGDVSHGADRGAVALSGDT
ncbi:methyltransferase-like protein 4 [Argonauta hians]